MNRQTGAYILVAVHLASGCSQESEQAAAARTAIQTQLAEEKARLDSMTPEEHAAEEKRKADEKAALEEKRLAAVEAQRKARERAKGLMWNYQTTRDDLTGKPSKYAYVSSKNTVTFDFPYEGGQRATLWLQKHPRYGDAIILELGQGQFLCEGSYGRCLLNVVFDDGPIMEFPASSPGDYDTKKLLVYAYPKIERYDFVGQLRNAKTLRIEARFYQEGNRTFEFNVEDLTWE